MKRLINVVVGYIGYAAIFGGLLSLLVTIIINIVRFNDLRLDDFVIIYPAIALAMLVLMIVSTARMKWVSAYRNEIWQFRLQFPNGWTARGADSKRDPNPEFDGPSSQIKFAIGRVTPTPTAADQRRKLQQIATQHGHECVKTALISIGGREHATIECRVPAVGLLKNYSLVFNGTEFLVTARGDFDQIDAIVKTFARLG